MLREQTAAALVSQRLPIIVLEDSAEGTQAEGSHDLQPDRALLLLVRPASHDSADAIDLAMKAGDRTWAARALVRSLAIPRILAGADDAVLRHIVEIKEFGESEPLLLAAAALAHSWLDLAESRACSSRVRTGSGFAAEATELVSLALLNVALASQRA